MRHLQVFPLTEALLQTSPESVEGEEPERRERERRRERESVCFIRFTRELCDDPCIFLPPPTICDLIDCNNGTCVTDVSGENFTYEWMFSGFTGEFCDILIPPPSSCELIDWQQWYLCGWHSVWSSEICQLYIATQVPLLQWYLCGWHFWGTIVTMVLAWLTFLRLRNVSHASTIAAIYQIFWVTRNVRVWNWISQTVISGDSENFIYQWMFSGFTGEFCDIILLPPPSTCNLCDRHLKFSGENFTTGQFCDVTTHSSTIHGIYGLINSDNGTWLSCIAPII